MQLICKDFISVNHYMNYRAVGKVVMAYKPKGTKDFEKNFATYLKQEIEEQHWIKPSKGTFVIMDTIFYMPRQDMDAQNYFKSLCDIMTSSGVWEDDNIVLERVNRIYYDSNNPRIEIEIYEAPFVGVFDNREEYQIFNNTCKTCKRYSNNCSIHKKAIECRIQSELTKKDEGWVCNKYSKLKL